MLTSSEELSELLSSLDSCLLFAFLWLNNLLGLDLNLQTCPFCSTKFIVEIK